jgi:cell division protein FtsW
MNWRLFAGLVVPAGGRLRGDHSDFTLPHAAHPGLHGPRPRSLGEGYQLSHALIAFGRGEVLGWGCGSVEKLFYLPEAHTDFLLAVIGEELGFVGVAAVIGLFTWLTLRAFAVGSQAARLERYFSALAAQGIGIWLGVQAIINIGVNLGLLPTKGLTLPFLSFGGSGLLANCTALALLLRIDWESRQLMRGSGGISMLPRQPA